VGPPGAERLVEATVDMGQPIYEHLAQIPVDRNQLGCVGIGRRAIIEILGRAFVMTFVSMGNPHAVIFEQDSEPPEGVTIHEFRRRAAAGEFGRDLTAADVRDWDLASLGPLIEHHPAFPNRINIHIASPISRRELVMRTWERGTGLTMACGSGACAVVVAGVITDRLERDVLVHLPGGDLRIRWPENNAVLMSGPATEVFEGDWPEESPSETA
jgi:diaminopimelate epimerase